MEFLQRIPTNQTFNIWEVFIVGVLHLTNVTMADICGSPLSRGTIFSKIAAHVSTKINTSGGCFKIFSLSAGLRHSHPHEKTKTYPLTHTHTHTFVYGAKLWLGILLGRRQATTELSGLSKITKTKRKELQQHIKHSHLKTSFIQ